MQAALQKTASYAAKKLHKIADNDLSSTADLYREGIDRAIVLTAQTLTVRFEGTAEAIDEGFPARDMKPALLASAHAKRGKRGTYLDVPFRHRVRNMPSDVQAMLKASASVTKGRVTGTMPGSTHNQLRYDSGGKSTPVSVERKTSIYSDMIRSRRGAVVKHSTIRRVSSNSAPDAWWHPGAKGVFGVRRISDDVRAYAKKALSTELTKRGFNVK